MRKLDEYHFIDTRDFLLIPIYLILIYLIGILFAKKTKENDLPLFKKAFFIKLTAGIIYGLVYQYFYGGGDTSVYFINGLRILEDKSLDFIHIFKLIFYPFSMNAPTRDLIENVSTDMTGFGANYFPIRLTILFGALSAKTYLNTCILFSAISFIGIWRNYKIFCTIYPKLRKQFNWAFLFLPSIMFWASGINKDTLCYGAFSLFTSFYFEIVVLKKYNIKNHVLMITSLLLIAAIKPYIVYSFLPVGILFYFKENILGRVKVAITRKLIVGFLLICIPILFLSQIDWFYDNIYNTVVNNLFYDLLNMNSYLQSMEDASNYDIGLSKLDPSNIDPLLFLQKLPICFTTTMFRPFIFETRNPFMLLSAIEGLLTLILFTYALFTVKFIGLFNILWNNTLISVVFLYSVIFSFFIGLTASNFGTLVRYKIPCFSYFIACLFIIIYLSKNKTKSKTK
jgi:hypothetical protein